LIKQYGSKKLVKYVGEIKGK